MGTAQELRAASSLRRWLRRAALAAIPAAGLACGSDRCGSDQIGAWIPDAGVPWTPGSQHSADECGRYCSSTYYPGCWIGELSGCSYDSSNTLYCDYTPTHCAPPPCGRLPAGIRCADAAEPVAAAAWLEGAAVFAFEALERELSAHRAPVGLIERARSARKDEKRHHRAMTALAARFGAAVQPVELEPVGIRSLLEVAVENAVEGCVRETWGAAVAAFQGECAADRAVRRTMRAIAVDEAEHAALGWAVDGWARWKLSAEERDEVDAARISALAGLVENTVKSQSSEILGLPGPEASAKMLAGLRPIWIA
ncbi:MAG: ferritin-like domain-containing protein [Myxococcales bacterium]|nr:ferritin-like domain-containing protein [Myxococcales bacterium]